MTLDSLHGLYLHELQDLYSAETQLVRALPKLAKAANSPELKSAFTNHLAQTKEHARRLEQLLTGLGQTAGGHKCKGMAGLIKEGNELIKQGGEPGVLDAALMTAARKVEHYEMAGYSASVAYAQMLRQDGAIDTLRQSLNEETQTDETLRELAEAVLSVAADARRVDDIAMHGDTEPGGVDMDSYEGALRSEADLDAEDIDTYKGATEEVDNDVPRTWLDESGGPGARGEPSATQPNNPSRGS
jgi:ferritin-like metal-binding protein YciE